MTVKRYPYFSVLCVFIFMTMLCGVLVLFVCFNCCDGKLQFASYYGDHMVLQRSPERAVVWGYGPEGAQVIVYLSGPTKQITSPVCVTKGIWQVTLDPVEPGGPYNVTAIVPEFPQSNSVTLVDVLFGDIWLCGGQSNMYFQTYQVFNASDELALAAKYPHVRFFMAALKMSETELDDLIEVEIPWSVPSARGVANFSAVCWMFGRHLYETLSYPIGLVESCWGGTPVEAWSSLKALKQCGLEKNSTDVPYKRNSVLWNSMIHPFLQMTLKGAIWYQGEANAGYHKDEYNCSFPAMINDWRKAFHQATGGQTAIDFPFGFVQLSTHEKGPANDGFAEIRWHQTADTGFVPNKKMQRTFMAVALDLPDENSPYGTIHPRDKQDVAERLSLGARAVAYNEKNVSFQGPFPYAILITKTYINISYDQTVSVTPSKDIFQICCSSIASSLENESCWVAAPIIHWDLTTVSLSTTMCSPVDEITAVRYAWIDWPCGFKACPIYSSSRVLPAPPFEVQHLPGKVKVWNRDGVLVNPKPRI